VEADNIDILIVAGEDTLLADVISNPKSGSPIVARGHEIMTKGSPANVPNGTVMALVNDHALPSIKRPQADCFVR
jgi:hypothetical protein